MIEASNACDVTGELAAKYKLVLGKCRQEPCAQISVVLCCAVCMKVSTHNIYKFLQVEFVQKCDYHKWPP